MIGSCPREILPLAFLKEVKERILMGIGLMIKMGGGDKVRIKKKSLVETKGKRERSDQFSINSAMSLTESMIVCPFFLFFYLFKNLGS